MNKIVSIIVPVYNAEKYIHTCLDSIINQTYEHLEIIIINDGSTDKSGELCEKIAQTDERITIIHQENKGPACARNKGLQEATGTYIQFVDADDEIKRTMTEMLVGAMRKDIQLIICGYETASKRYVPAVLGAFGKEQFLQHIGELYKGTTLSSSCNKLYRLSTIKQESIQFLADCTFGEDLLFNLDYIQVCNAVRLLPDTLYQYNHIPNSLTNRFNPDLLKQYTMLYQEVKLFLTLKNCYEGENHQYLRETYSNGIIHSLTNVLHRQNRATKTAKLVKINSIMNDPNVSNHLPYLTHSYQAQIIRLFVKAKLAFGIFFVLKMKTFIKLLKQNEIL